MCNRNTGAWRLSAQVLAIGLWLGAMAGPLQAAAPHLIEYSAYKKAFEAGDVPSALRHGEAAWQEAEKALGDDATTAVLAYNFARLAFAFPATAERALQAYERALVLTERGIGDLSAQDVRIGLTEVRLILRQNESTTANELARLLTERQRANVPASDLSAHAWKTLAIARMRDMDHDTVIAYADIAAAEAQALQPPDQQVLVDSLVLGAMARLSRSGPEKTQETIDEAIQRLDRVIALYPPQRDIDSFDPLLAKALVWRASVQAMVGTEKDPIDVLSLIRMSDDGRPSNCPDIAALLQRTPLEYPDNALRTGRVGAVLFGLDWKGTAVDRVVILAEPAGTGFGAATETTLRSWTLSQPVPEACGKDFVSFVSFTQE